MRIRVLTVEHRYGYLEIDVPDDGKFMPSKRKVRQLAEEAVSAGTTEIVWTDDTVTEIQPGYVQID